MTRVAQMLFITNFLQLSIQITIANCLFSVVVAAAVVIVVVVVLW